MIGQIKKNIEWLIYLFIFLLPLATVWIIKENFISGFKWQEGTYLLYATEILLWFIFIGYFYWSLNDKKFSIFNFQFSKIDKSKLTVVILIWALTFWSFLSILWSDNQPLSFYYWLKLAEGVTLALIILNWRLAFYKLSWALVLSGALQPGFAIIQFLTQKVIAFKWLGIAAHLPIETTASVIEINGARWLRAYGSFPHPNILGGFLALAFISALYLYFNYRSGWKKILFLTALLVIFVGLFFSFSRSVWLAVAAALVIFLSFYVKKYFSEVIKLVLNLGLVFLILFSLYSPLLLTRLEFAQRLEIRSVERRAESLLEASEVIKNNWLMGTGLGNYTNYLIVSSPPAPGWSYQPVHNLYLLVMSELGLIGLIILLLLIIKSFLASLKKFQHNPVYLSWLAIVLIIGLFDHYFWTAYPGIILLMLILLIVFSDDKIMAGGWNKAAKEYSQLIGERGDFVRELLINPYLRKQLKITGSGKILDLGCGEGYLSRVFSSGSFQYTGVDSSSELLAEAKNKKTPGQFIQADICKPINLPAESFEAVIGNMVLMDVPDLAAAYYNAYKFLKPGGLLIITILHPVLGAPSGQWFKTLGAKILRQEPFIRINKYGREFFDQTVIANLTQPTQIYHRPLSKYIQTALESGLILKDISEPMFEEADLFRFHQSKFLAKAPVILALTFMKPGQ